MKFKLPIVLYLVILFYAVFLTPARLERGLHFGAVKYNLIPLVNKNYTVTKKHSFDNLSNTSYIDLLGNIFLFLPFPLLLKRTFSKLQKEFILLIPILFSVFIELTQYLTGLGFADVDDVIMNLLGTIIGFALLLVTKRFKKLLSY